MIPVVYKMMCFQSCEKFADPSIYGRYRSSIVKILKGENKVQTAGDSVTKLVSLKYIAFKQYRL